MSKLVKYKAGKKNSKCARYWGERRDVIVSLLYTVAVMGIVAFLYLCILCMPHPTPEQIILLWYGLIPFSCLVVAALMPSAELLEDILHDQDVECPFEDNV